MSNHSNKRKATDDPCEDDVQSPMEKRARLPTSTQRPSCVSLIVLDEKAPSKPLCSECHFEATHYAYVASKVVCRLCICCLEYRACQQCNAVQPPKATRCSECGHERLRVAMPFRGENSATDDGLKEVVKYIVVGDHETDSEELRLGAWRYLSSIPGGVDVTFELFKLASKHNKQQ